MSSKAFTNFDITNSKRNREITRQKLPLDLLWGIPHINDDDFILTLVCGHYISFAIFCLLKNPQILNGLFGKLLNQYQACLYLFGCISLCESKYGNEILKLWDFWTILVQFLTIFWQYLDLLSAHACRL